MTRTESDRVLWGFPFLRRLFPRLHPSWSDETLANRMALKAAEGQ